MKKQRVTQPKHTLGLSIEERPDLINERSEYGQATAVNVIVSSGYGFICGAYIPLSSLSSGMQRIFSFLPGTYGTALVKNHALSSPLNHFKSQGVSVEFIDELKKYLDINLTFFNSSVSQLSMYVIMIVSIFLFILVFILQNKLKNHV